MNNLTSLIFKQLFLLLICITPLLNTSAQSVWPGDMNNNGIANYVDILYGGWAYSVTGASRDSTSTDWMGFPAPADWSQNFPNGNNFYYADADGSGAVDLEDFHAVSSNYGLIHTTNAPDELWSEHLSEAPPVSLAVNTNTNVVGNELHLNLSLGNDNFPVNSFHGITFDINYSSVANTNVVAVDYTASDLAWTNEGAETYTRTRLDPNSNKINFVSTRNTQETVGGNGYLGNFIVIIEDIVLNVDTDTLHFEIDNVKLVGHNLETHPVAPEPVNIVVHRDSSSMLPNCDISISYEQHSCNSFTFFEDNQTPLFWTVNGESLSTNNAQHAIDFDPQTPGTYIVCGIFETVECPNGASDCDTLVITEDCFPNDCEFNVEINQQSCAGYDLFSTEQVQLDWYVNDVFQLTGIGYDFYPNTPGTYQICVVNEGCPPETNFCETFVITEDCFVDPCAFSTSYEQHDCNSFTFFSDNQTPLYWTANGEFFPSANAQVAVDFDPTEPGTYIVCGILDTPNCPNTTPICDTIFVSPDCFPDSCLLEIAITQNSCASYSFAVQEPWDEQLYWTVDGGEIVSFGEGFGFEASEAGTYEICGGYENATCPIGIQQCFTVVVDSDCFIPVDSCNFEVLVDMHNCASYTFHASGQDNIYWSINGDYQSTASGFDFDPTTPGTYEICGAYESADCPLGEVICNTVTITEECLTASGIVLRNDGVFIYPNPASDFLNITLASGDYCVRILGADGTFYQQVNISGTETIDISALPSGLFFLDIKSNTTGQSMLTIILKQ